MPAEEDEVKGDAIERRIWVTDSPGNLRNLHQVTTDDRAPTHSPGTTPLCYIGKENILPPRPLMGDGNILHRLALLSYLCHRGPQETELLVPPGPGEVRVKVEAIGLNFADIFTVLGMYDAAPKGVRIIPGLEFAGVVEEVGKAPKKKISKVGRSADGKRNVVVGGEEQGDAVPDDLSRYPFRPGDRVMGVTRFGAYTSHLNIGTPYIRKIPDYWSFQQGAAFVVQVCVGQYMFTTLCVCACACACACVCACACACACAHADPSVFDEKTVCRLQTPTYGVVQFPLLELL